MRSAYRLNIKLSLLFNDKKNKPLNCILLNFKDKRNLMGTNDFQNESRLTFVDPTNFNLPITVFNTLVEDAYYFGYVKNNQANLSGLLNHLIPNLSDYRSDLHDAFLLANDGDSALTDVIEENIYKVYFNKYNYCDDGVAIVPFRVNKEHMQRFLHIVDNVIHSLKMDFSSYMRSLLVEYCSKRLNQREYFFYYKEIEVIKTAIENNVLCYFYTADEKSSFVPVSVELSRITDQNLIVGIAPENANACVLPLSYLKRVVPTERTFDIEDEDISFAYETIAKYEKEQEEKMKCSD